MRLQNLELDKNTEQAPKGLIFYFFSSLKQGLKRKVYGCCVLTDEVHGLLGNSGSRTGCLD